MSRHAIGQAVVTDPATGRGGGYVLVAASESVAPEDAHHLSAAPQVTDYLHLEESPGPFFSFYRLPSGSWAAVKRFVRGTRRGSFNRVVAHTLVVPSELLHELAEEPWLLWTRCRFRPRGAGAEATPAELTEQAGEPGLDRLADLECLAPEDPRTERAALLVRRCDFLRQRWGERVLGERLRAVLAALLRGRRPLLPQGAEEEQLLTVAWSVLPAPDRLETPWTTHLASAAGNLFRLANCTDPKASRAEQEDPEHWALPLEEPDDGEEVSGALAAALLDADVDLRALDDGFRRYGLRLAKTGPIRRFIDWSRRGGGLAPEDALPAPPQGREERELLLRLLLEAPEVDAAALAELAVGLARCASPRAGEAFAHLADLPGGLDLAAERARSREDELPVMRVLLREAGRTRDVGVAARVAADLLFPLLLDEPRLDSGLSGQELSLALVSLQRRPAVLVALLRRGSPELRETAAGELARWVDHGLPAAREAAASLAAAPDAPSRAPALAGAAERLHRMEAPARDWIPFALAELRDERSDQRRFVEFLGDVQVAEADARKWIDALLDEVQGAIAENRLGEGHRTLLRAMRSGSPARPEKTVAVAARLTETPSPELVRWGETVARLAEELDRGGAPRQASALRGNYWRALAHRRWQRFPVATLDMLPGLRGEDRRRIAELWIPEIARLQNRPGEKELVSALAGLVDPRSAEQRFRYELGRLRLAMNFENLDLVAAVARAGEILRDNGSGTVFAPHMTRALRELLPRDPERRAAAVLRLLLSPALPPSTKRVIETELCDASLRQAGTALPGLVPPVRELAARGPLLLRAAARLGEQWRADPAAVKAFLRDAVRLQRFDAVAALLRTSERSRPGLLAGLATEGDSGLLRRMKRAVDEVPLARRYLRPHLGALTSSRRRL